MRVAFSIFGGDSWTGGVNYLRNLLSALSELPHNAVEPILFHSPEADIKVIDLLRPFLAEPPIVVAGWSGTILTRLRRLIGSTLFQRDWISEQAFLKAKIDVVFLHGAWYGLAFPLPTLAWIPDFQHKHLPGMFDRVTLVKRDLGYAALSLCATCIMVSSEDAKKDAERYFPAMRRRLEVVPFRVQVPEAESISLLASIRSLYNLPEHYFFLPNQFWRHKNHLQVVEALHNLKQQGKDIIVAVSGNPRDGRNPKYPESVFALVKQYGLEKSFLYLGMIPYEHIKPLMMGSAAVINPSLFEGWSTTVEEARAVGVPLLLSNIGVHIEQAADIAIFFDPSDSMSLAEALEKKWMGLVSVDRDDVFVSAIASYKELRREFAERFLRALVHTVERRGYEPQALK